MLHVFCIDCSSLDIKHIFLCVNDNQISFNDVAISLLKAGYIFTLTLYSYFIVKLSLKHSYVIGISFSDYGLLFIECNAKLCNFTRYNVLSSYMTTCDNTCIVTYFISSEPMGNEYWLLCSSQTWSHESSDLIGCWESQIQCEAFFTKNNHSEH